MHTKAIWFGLWAMASASFAGGAAAQDLTVETDVDYYGGDYTSFVPAKPDAEICRQACAKDKKCVAYTFLRPRDAKTTGRCYLKAKLGKRTANKCCVSGVRKAPTKAQAPAAAPTAQMQSRAAAQPTPNPGPAVTSRSPLSKLTEKLFKAPHAGAPNTPPPAPRSTPTPRQQANLSAAPGAALPQPGVAPQFRQSFPPTLLDRLKAKGLTPRSSQISADGLRAEVDVGTDAGNRIGPVQRPCPRLTPEEKARLEKKRQDLEKDIYQRCLAESRFAGDIPTSDEDYRCQQRARLESVPKAKDVDGDGVADWCDGGADCDDQDANRYPGNWEVPDPNFRDEDCDPATIGEEDRDGDGFIAARDCNWNGARLVCGTDCNDLDPSVRPNQGEVCNGKDDNCNGLIDEGVSHPVYRDADGDGFGDPAFIEMRCHPGDGWVSNNTDCDDTNRARNPRNPGSCS